MVARWASLCSFRQKWEGCGGAGSAAHPRLSFGVLQDCHGVGVWGRMAHDSWAKHSSQVTDVHPSFCGGSDSARGEGAEVSVCHTRLIDINTLTAPKVKS